MMLVYFSHQVIAHRPAVFEFLMTFPGLNTTTLN